MLSYDNYNFCEMFLNNVIFTKYTMIILPRCYVDEVNFITIRNQFVIQKHVLSDLPRYQTKS